MMDSPIPIQLCLQGGAAKIALLAAFTEAIEELHNAGDLRVTHVAGTSAGAIIGTLFAADVPMSTVRNRLGSASLGKIVPPKGKVRLGWALGKGNPVWSEDELRTLLTSMLTESKLLKRNPPERLETFDDILKHRGIHAEVMATDLTNGMSSVKGAGDSLINSLLDSAAIPFFFRAMNSPNATIVDGGLCENLPIDRLSDDENDGPIVAVSFLRNPGVPPKGLLEYCLAVVGAGIDHSADRASRLLEERATRLSLPHKVYRINSPIESFDFEKAVRDGLGRFYEEVRDKARAWLIDFVAKRRAQIRQKQEMAEREAGQLTASSRETDFYKHAMPKNLARMYKAQHEPAALHWSQARLTVTVSASHDRPDAVHHEAEFHTLEKPVWCHRLPILVAPQSGAALRSGWILFGPDKKRISYYHMVMDEDGDPSTLELLVCFETPLPPQSGPYSLVLVESVSDFMKPLRNRQRDDLWVSFHRRKGPVDKVEVIAYVPRTMPGIQRIQLEPMAGATSSDIMDEYELKDGPPDHDSYGMRGKMIDLNLWGVYLKPILSTNSAQ